MRKVKWIAGFNMPGYMPDSEPWECESFRQAKASILEALEWEADCKAEEENTEALEGIDEGKKWAQAQRSEFSVHVGNYVYWVVKE